MAEGLDAFAVFRESCVYCLLNLVYYLRQRLLNSVYHRWVRFFFFFPSPPGGGDRFRMDPFPLTPSPMLLVCVSGMRWTHAATIWEPPHRNTGEEGKGENKMLDMVDSW